MVCGMAAVGDQEARGRSRRPPAPRVQHVHRLGGGGASSSSEALAIGSPVRSPTIVWKFSSASSRPCEISAWYGVYWVYQPGFSRMLRWITGGVMQSE